MAQNSDTGAWQYRTGVVMNIYWLVISWWCLVIDYAPRWILFVHDLDPLDLSLVVLIIQCLNTSRVAQNKLLLHLSH